MIRSTTAMDVERTGGNVRSSFRFRCERDEHPPRASSDADRWGGSTLTIQRPLSAKRWKLLPNLPTYKSRRAPGYQTEDGSRGLSNTPETAHPKERRCPHMETRNTPVLREIIEVLSSEVDTMHFGWGWWGYLPIVTKKRRKRERIYTSVALVCLFCPTKATLRDVAAGRLVRAPLPAPCRCFMV